MTEPTSASEQTAEQNLAQVQVALATAAADATPLSALALTTRDLSRVQPLLEQVLEAVMHLLEAPMGAVWVTDPQGQELYPVAWRHLPDDYMEGLRVSLGEGSVGLAVQRRAPVLLTDITQEPTYVRHLERARAEGIVTAFSVPLLTLNGEPMGALAGYFATPTEPPPETIGYVELYARQAAEIVERARLYAEAQQITALQQRSNTQLRSLADAALAMSAADSVDDLLRLVTEAARDIVGTHQGVTSRLRHGWVDAMTYVSLSETYAEWREYGVVPRGLGVLEFVVRENCPLRLTGPELLAHPEWRGLRDAPDHPPLPDYLAAPLIGRNGANLGLIQLSHRYDEQPFSEADEAIVVQLAQMASSTIETVESLERERAARGRAEETARTQRALADAATEFAELLEPSLVARVLVDTVVPLLGELAVLHLVDDDGAAALAALACVDPLLRPIAEDFFGRFPVSTSQPYGAGYVLATGEPQLLPQLSEEILQAVTTEQDDLDVLRQITYASGVCVPLSAHGKRLGALSLSRDAPYRAADVDYLRDLASRAALALDNAQRFAFERDLAGTLQRSLLPRSTPATNLLTTAARYRPGTQDLQIGGDWYDVISVSDGRLIIVVGDVMGHGVQAAAVMGQLRAALRAYALEGHDPAALLTRLDRFVQAMDELTFTTCVIGLLDPQARTLCLSSAGHLSPLLISPDGQAEFLELDSGLPLGVGGSEFVDQAFDLEPGATVLLYTDGLVEGRATPVDDGMQQLRQICTAPVRSAEELCSRVLEAMSGGDGHEDDTALLALLLTDERASGGVTPLHLELPAVAESAARVRAGLREMLGEARGQQAEVAALLLTELVSNAVRHAGGEIVVRASLRGPVLMAEVSDGSERAPRVTGERRSDTESGRGMLLIDQLADRWGVEPLPTGKRVWFELSLDST